MDYNAVLMEASNYQPRPVGETCCDGQNRLWEIMRLALVKSAPENFAQYYNGYVIPETGTCCGVQFVLAQIKQTIEGE